jgi:hypothetical protein
MEIPDLIKRRLGEESIESAVNLGDEDVICFTPSRALLYRGEGLIGDESVEEFDCNVERLNVSDGRRKMSFRLQYVDGEESFSVSSDRGEAVVQRLLQSILRTANVLDPDESVQDAYRFSELTIIITDQRLVKHVGAYVWDGEFEEYHFGDVTGLDFEKGSVATQIVLSVSGRPQRFKAPSDEAKLLRRALTNALCEYYEVGSLSQLNRVLDEKTEDDDSTDDSVASDIELDDSISPLVGDTDEEPALDGEVREIGESRPEEPTADSTATQSETSDDGDTTQPTTAQEETTTAQEETTTATTAGGQTAGWVDPAEFEAMQTQVSKLTTAVKRQNELLKEQHQTIQQLIEELQRRE